MSSAGRPGSTAATVATVAFVTLVVLVPLVLGFLAFASLFTLGGEVASRQRETAMWMGVAGAASALVGVVVTLIAAGIARRVSVAVLAAIAVLVGIVFGGACAVVAWSQFFGGGWSSRGEVLQPVEEQRPDCGPHAFALPSSQGPRIRLCEQELRVGEELATSLRVSLPITDVTPELVDALVETGTLRADGFVSSGVLDGHAAAVWSPAELTCVTATWDGAAWTVEVVGLRQDGGCLMYDGQWSPGA